MHKHNPLPQRHSSAVSITAVLKRCSAPQLRARVWVSEHLLAEPSVHMACDRVVHLPWRRAYPIGRSNPVNCIPAARWGTSSVPWHRRISLTRRQKRELGIRVALLDDVHQRELGIPSPSRITSRTILLQAEHYGTDGRQRGPRCLAPSMEAAGPVNITFAGMSVSFLILCISCSLGGWPKFVSVLGWR